MKKLLGIVVLGLLWCNISFSDSYRLFSTEEYISKRDAEIIFEMSRTEWNKTVKNFQGNTGTPALEKILLKSTTDNSESEIKVSGAFIAIGHDPATSLFLNKIKIRIGNKTNIACKRNKDANPNKIPIIV